MLRPQLLDAGNRRRNEELAGHKSFLVVSFRKERLPSSLIDQ
jgi:hypothetical protein